VQNRLAGATATEYNE